MSLVLFTPWRPLGLTFWWQFIGGRVKLRCFFQISTGGIFIPASLRNRMSKTDSSAEGQSSPAGARLRAPEDSLHTPVTVLDYLKGNSLSVYTYSHSRRKGLETRRQTNSAVKLSPNPVRLVSNAFIGCRKPSLQPWVTPPPPPHHKSNLQAGAWGGKKGNETFTGIWAALLSCDDVDSCVTEKRESWITSSHW